MQYFIYEQYIKSSGVVLGNGTLILNTDDISGDIKYSAISTLNVNASITNNIDFVGNEGVLQLADNQIITGNVDSSSAAAGTLEFLGTGTVTGDIGKTNALTRLKFSGAGDITLPKANVKIYEIANAGAKVTANDALKGNILFSSDGSLLASKGITGSITTNIDNTGSITICGGDVGTIGEEYKKLKQVNLNQASDSSVRKLYSANLNVSDKDSIIFHDNIRANNIDIKNSNIEISDNISIYGNINASNSSILLDNNILILSGTNTFANQITISSTYDALHLSGGSIIIPTGATLDLSNVSNLIIKLSLINSDISKINEDTRYSIILTEDGSNIILLSNPENQVQLDNSGEQNKFVKWTLDPQSLTLYASDNANNVIDRDYVFASQQNNTFMQQLKNILQDSSAQKFKNNIGMLSKKQVEDMIYCS